MEPANMTPASEPYAPLHWWHSLLALGMMLACALLFWNPASQSASWMYPYFSGAANLGADLAWRVDAGGFADFAALTYRQQTDYHFASGDAANLVPYSVLDMGYVFVVWLAQHLFYWLPPIKAVLWLQVLFHMAVSLWVMGRLPSRRAQLVFLLAYALNPVVLHFVTFAYHYCWQVIPALAWFYYDTRRGVGTRLDLMLIALLLAVAFLIRQSTVIVSLLILVHAAWRQRGWVGWALVACFLIFVGTMKNPSQPWHTAYVGLGAYPNDAAIELSDESGYALFRERTGIQIDTTPPDGNYYDATVRGQYYEVLKERLAQYANDHPLQMARNAALNGAQSFSVGYPVGHRTLAYVSALCGIVVLLVLAWRRMYVTIALLLASVAGFVAYYPPIPAYMFGNYLILALALATILGATGKPATQVAVASS
jgi:hypothetical protein